ncbi:MAG: hypothetical protein AB4426_22670 [Xenococcaceae cyanobacterium]
MKPPKKPTVTHIIAILVAAGETLLLVAAITACGEKPPKITPDTPELTPNQIPPQTSLPESPNTAIEIPPSVQLKSPPPTIDEINSAISKLQAMNPNQVLEFPLEENPSYRIIGFKFQNDQYIGLNVRFVESFLKDSLKTKGEFPKTSQVELIVRNQSTNQRLILKPLSKNVPLENFVRVLNNN